MSSDTRTSLNNALDAFAGFGLRVGGVVAGLGLAYLLYVIFGPKLAAMKSMKAADRQTLLQSVSWARAMLTWGGGLLILSACIRFFYEQTIGLILTLLGAALYFLAPGGLASLTMGSFAASTASNGKIDPAVELYQSIVHDLALVGLFCLVPGCLLLVRDVIWSICKRSRVRHQPLTEEEKTRAERLRKHRKLYEKCWDMSVCNERARRFCAAWQKRKPCWQIKAGCLCDETIMKQALLDRDREAGLPQQTPAVDTRPKVVLTAQQKKERCRNCTIFLEHQRQKFRIVTPTALVLVGGLYAVLYTRLYAWLYEFFERLDKFMSFLTYQKGHAESFASHGNTVTTLGMICLGIVLLSFTFRAVEWLIFDRHL